MHSIKKATAQVDHITMPAIPATSSALQSQVLFTKLLSVPLKPFFTHSADGMGVPVSH